jgi:ribulose-phosphate 3-epimerase
MDGRFVPNITYGTKVIETVRRLTELPLDVHLMVVEPERFFDDFVEAGATGLTVHAEVTPHLNRQLARIRELGAAAGVALNPSTSLLAVENVLDDLDLLLVMTVNPGFGGQRFIPHSLEKIGRARRMLDEVGSHAVLEVDGGIDRETIYPCWRAGADAFVAGNAVFSADDPRAEIGALRAQCVERA